MRSALSALQMALYDMRWPSQENFCQKPCSVSSCQLVAMSWSHQMVSIMSQKEMGVKAYPPIGPILLCACPLTGLTVAIHILPILQSNWLSLNV